MHSSAIVLGILLAASAQEKPEAVPMTWEEVVAIKTGKTPEAEAKKWDGKIGEFTLTSRQNSQDVKFGPNAGQTLFGFKDERKGQTRYALGFYTTDKKTIEALKAREVGQRTPFKIRGKIVIDYSNTVHILLREAKLVNE